jgi:DNA-binding MarR family transcriptional regulator
MSPIMRKQVDQVNQNPSQAASQLVDAMHKIMHLYRTQQHRSLRDAQHDLAHMEIKVLGFFARHPGGSPSDLVAHSGRDKAQVARLIRGLRERGLLDAEADAHDRRSTRLTLSAAGQELHTALHSHDGELAEAALAGISDAERATLAALLGRVRANLEAGPG